MASTPRNTNKNRAPSTATNGPKRHRRTPGSSSDDWIDEPENWLEVLPQANPRHDSAPLCPVDAHQVIKRLKPGQAGTRGLARRFGSALVCVRYRESDSGTTRFTTVELVVDKRPARRQPLIRVKIRFDDAPTRRQAMALGAKWDEVERTWRMPRRAAIQLGLLTNRPKSKPPK
jgi:hypothetical protein